MAKDTGFGLPPALGGEPMTARDWLKALMTPEVEVTVGLVVLICPVCGIVFALPKALWVAWKEGDDGFHCPNGDELTRPRTTEGTLQHLIDKYVDEPKEGRTMRRLRTQLAQEKHDREQLEAEVTSLRAARGRRPQADKKPKNGLTRRRPPSGEDGPNPAACTGPRTQGAAQVQFPMEAGTRGSAPRPDGACGPTTDGRADSGVAAGQPVRRWRRPAADRPVGGPAGRQAAPVASVG